MGSADKEVNEVAVRKGTDLMEVAEADVAAMVERLGMVVATVGAGTSLAAGRQCSHHWRCACSADTNFRCA